MVVRHLHQLKPVDNTTDSHLLPPTRQLSLYYRTWSGQCRAQEMPPLSGPSLTPDRRNIHIKTLRHLCAYYDYKRFFLYTFTSLPMSLFSRLIVLGWILHEKFCVDIFINPTHRDYPTTLRFPDRIMAYWTICSEFGLWEWKVAEKEDYRSGPRRWKWLMKSCICVATCWKTGKGVGTPSWLENLPNTEAIWTQFYLQVIGLWCLSHR